MKKTLIALAVLTVSSAAFAQSTVTLSGSIQAGVVNSGVDATSATVGSLGSGANAININSVEDLGGGMRAGFSGQMRFSSANGEHTSAATGTYAGALFHSANAYVSGGFGTVRIGKIAEASTCGLDPWACGGGASLSAGNGVNALTGAASVNSAVNYTTPSFNGFTASYQTSLTALTPAQSASSGRTNERQAFNLAYSKGPLTLTYLDIRGGANSGASTAPPADDASKHTAIGGSYNFGVARLSLVNTVSKANTNPLANRDVMSVGLTVPMGAYTILAGYNKDSKAAANGDTKIAAGVNYALSKRTTIGADVFKADAQFVPGSSTTYSSNVGTGFVLRVGHTF